MTPTVAPAGTTDADLEGFRERLGRCYELSGRLVMGACDGSLLVHGTIQGGGHPRIGHAWVIRPDGAVYDPVLDQEFPADVHALVFSAHTEQVYDLEGVAVEALRSGHWGPWPTPHEAGPQ